LKEVAKDPGDMSEWADIIILGIDGAFRAGYSPGEIVSGIRNKFDRNQRRIWPDWRKAEPGKAIEHIKEDLSPLNPGSISVRIMKGRQKCLGCGHWIKVTSEMCVDGVGGHQGHPEQVLDFRPLSLEEVLNEGGVEGAGLPEILTRELIRDQDAEAEARASFGVELPLVPCMDCGFMIHENGKRCFGQGHPENKIPDDFLKGGFQLRKLPQVLDKILTLIPEEEDKLYEIVEDYRASAVTAPPHVQSYWHRSAISVLKTLGRGDWVIEALNLLGEGIGFPYYIEKGMYG
jgi:hypothetical protein